MSPRRSEMRALFEKCRTSHVKLGYLRKFAELMFKVYLSMEAESAIGVSNSCDLAWSAQMRGVRRVRLCAGVNNKVCTCT